MKKSILFVFGVLTLSYIATTNINNQLELYNGYSLDRLSSNAIASEGEAYPEWEGYIADSKNSCCKQRYWYDVCSAYSVSCD